MLLRSTMTSSDAKVVDLQKDTVEIDDKKHMTTDYGIKISNADNWLRVADENHSGPSLLEDQIAREKVEPEIPVELVRISTD